MRRDQRYFIIFHLIVQLLLIKGRAQLLKEIFFSGQKKVNSKGFQKKIQKNLCKYFELANLAGL